MYKAIIIILHKRIARALCPQREQQTLSARGIIPPPVAAGYSRWRGGLRFRLWLWLWRRASGFFKLVALKLVALEKQRLKFQQLDSPSGPVVLHYRDHGEKTAPTLVFANSLGTDFRIWDALIDGLAAALDRPLRVICYDKRGHGLSDAPASPYAMSDHVDDLEALLDHLAVTAAVVTASLAIGRIV